MALRIDSSPSYSVIIAARPEKRTKHGPHEVFTNRLQKNTQSSLLNLEQIISYTAASWWTLPSTVVKPSKKKAELAHKNFTKAFLQTKTCLCIPIEAGFTKKCVYLQQREPSPVVFFLILSTRVRLIQKSYMVFCLAQGLPAM